LRVNPTSGHDDILIVDARDGLMRLALWRAPNADAETRREWALVAAAWVLIVAVTAVWLALDRRPPEWDHANHLERVVTCAHDMARGDVRTVLERSSFYPPLVPCAAAAIYRWWPSDAAAAQSAILLFLGVAMAVIYRLGRELADGTAGVAAAWIFASAPFVVYSGTRFQLDLPLATMAAVAFLVVLRTDGFQHPGWSLVAGGVWAIGMLTKPTFAVYAFAPIVWVLIRERNRRSCLNATLAVAVAAALSLPWYGPRLIGLPAQLAYRSGKGAMLEGKPETFTLTALSFYPTWIFTQLGVLAVGLLLAGLIVALRQRRGLAIAAFAAPFIVSMLVRNKDLRYTLPLLPMAAVLAGIAVSALGRRWRPWVATGLIVVGAGQVSGTLFGLPPAFRLPMLGVPTGIDTPPMRTEWHHRDILRAISRASRGAAVTVSVVPNYNFFSVSNFRYYATREGLPIRFLRAWDGEPLGVDYVVLKTGPIGPSWTAAKIERLMERFAREPDLSRVYPVIAEFALPDGSKGTLRARRVTDAVAGSPGALARTFEEETRRRLPEVARDVEGLTVRLTYDDALARGRVQRVEIAAAVATVGELTRRGAAALRVRNVRLLADDVLVNPFSLGDGRLDLLDVGRLRLEHAEVSAGDLQAFLDQLKEARGVRIRLVEDRVEVAIAHAGPDFDARVRIVPAIDRPFALRVERVRVGPIPLPPVLIDWIARNYDPTQRIASRLPFPVEIAPVSIAGQSLRIGGASASGSQNVDRIAESR
jgi:Dolichyl-phosphate-mannose-protein mannosyltransferase